MKIYKDLVSGDEMFSDTYPMELLYGAVYKVKGRMVMQSTQIDESAFGFNASAEGQGDGEGADDGMKSVIDIVDGNKLVEMPPFAKKKDYMGHLKEYFKSVKAKLESEDDKKAFQDGAAEFVNAEIKNDFKEFQFYVGESMNPDGMHALCKWDGETPEFYFFKHGLEEEKC